MAKTVANQNIVIVKKTPVSKDFLQIQNEEWMQACIDCEKSFGAFKLYLFLASNEVGYNFALSPAAFENKLKVKKTGYYNAIDTLKELGYLVDIGNHKMEFYTKAVSSIEENSSVKENSSIEEKSSAEEKIINFSSGKEKSSQEENSAVEEKVYETFNF